MTDHEANELAEQADQARNTEHEREQEESLAYAIAKDAALLLGVERVKYRGDFWTGLADAVADPKYKAHCHAMASLYMEAASYTERTQRKPAA